MTTPDEYKTRLEALRVQLEIETAAEAKAALADIRYKQEQVRQIKREINLDMKEIQAQYQKRQLFADAAEDIFSQFSGQRKRTEQRSASAKKRKVEIERERALWPYETLKVSAGDLLLELERVKIHLQNLMEQEKASFER